MYAVRKKMTKIELRPEWKLLPQLSFRSQFNFCHFFANSVHLCTPDRSSWQLSLGTISVPGTVGELTLPPFEGTNTIPSHWKYIFFCHVVKCCQRIQPILYWKLLRSQASFVQVCSILGCFLENNSCTTLVPERTWIFRQPFVRGHQNGDNFFFKQSQDAEIWLKTLTMHRKPFYLVINLSNFSS